MNARQADILLRRQVLLVRVAAQRVEVAQALRPWKQPLRLVDTALAVGRFIRAHPVPAALVIGILAVRRRNLKGLAGIALRLWEIYRLFLSRSAASRGL